MTKQIAGVLFLLLAIQINCLSQEENQSIKDTTAYKRLTKFPLALIDYTKYGESNYNDDLVEGNIEMAELRGGFQFAAAIQKEKIYFLNKVDFTYFKFNTSHSAYKRDEEFYSLAYSIGLIKVLKNRWRAVGIITPTVASDFQKNLSTEDFILQASVIASKRSSPYFEYGLGMAFTTRFGRELLVPIINATYKKSNWEFNAVLPAYISESYNFKNSKLGVKLSIFGNLYNFKNDTPADIDLDKFGYSRINIGPNYQKKLYKALYLNMEAGVTLRNRLEFMDGDGDIELNLSTKEKYFYRVGINVLM